MLAVVGLVQFAPVRMAWAAPATRAALVRDATAGARAVGFPASHLGVRWTGDEEAVVEVRTLGPGGWTDWQPVTVDHDLTDAAGGPVIAGLLRVDRAEKIETRVVSGDARDVEVHAIDTRNGPKRLVRAKPASATASMADTRVGQPGVITRAQWGADESLRRSSPSFAPIKRLIVHHTVTGNGDPDPAATVRAIYTYHVQGNGWADIGYNFLVDEQGRVYEGRYSRRYAAGEVPTGEDTSGRGVVGAHAGGANTGSVGIAMLGTYTSVGPTANALNGLQAMLAWKADRHDINVQASATFTRSDGATVQLPNISGHRDSVSTSCPGQVLYDMLPGIRDRVSRIIASAHGLTKGYWTAASDGRVYAFGEAPFHGSMEGKRMNAPVIAMTTTPNGGGYWLLGSDGGIFSFGNAVFHGSTGGMRLNKPVVAMAATPTGNGYWLVASDGGIFTFGDAQFFGSMGGKPLNKPVVGMAPTRSGFGYWLVASDGGIFTFGDAAFYGSTGSIKLNSPITSMTAASDGSGYWMVAGDGGVFAFNVPFHGSVPGLGLSSFAGSSAMRATSTRGGYYVLGLDGSVYTFGDARFHGARAVSPAAARDMALLDAPPTS
ncbi:MAG TPA: N-acetylmuramoyl-L-alanine amidase [Acidimicrobiales bacterium]|nr:N-acetylmuramoyl-L-alanine amidase [Acidimicrobiales bacterium]